MSIVVLVIELAQVSDSEKSPNFRLGFVDADFYFPGASCAPAFVLLPRAV